MNDECTLSEKADEGTGAPKLPTRRPDRMWGGPGLGADCAICRAPVKREEIEFELEFARDSDDPGQDTFHVHVRCFTIWERSKIPPEAMAGDGTVGVDGVELRHRRCAGPS
jgi:hypothetical protein